MKKTFNPFKTIGSWLGLLLGYLFFLKGLDAFAPVFKYTGIPITDLLARDMTAGFMLGFTAHLFLRAVVNIGMFKNNKKEHMEEYTDEKL